MMQHLRSLCLGSDLLNCSSRFARQKRSSPFFSRVFQHAEIHDSAHRHISGDGGHHAVPEAEALGARGQVSHVTCAVAQRCGGNGVAAGTRSCSTACTRPKTRRPTTCDTSPRTRRISPCIPLIEPHPPHETFAFSVCRASLLSSSSFVFFCFPRNKSLYFCRVTRRFNRGRAHVWQGV
jgi:hypothetical protein